MAPRKWIDKKTATTYSVVNRARDDPLFHDDEASQAVLVEAPNLNEKSQKEARKNKWITGSALKAQASDFSREGMRDNEGEAALYGITFDDSTYDYMQHLRPIGVHEDSVFVSKNGKAKPSQSDGLQFKEDAPPSTGFQMPAEVLPSVEKVPLTYQSQQAVPDAIAGLQPDMDPRLREVLEALDDEEYVEESDDIFGELLGGGEAKDEAKWKANAPKEEIVRKDGEQDWEYEFRKFKLDSKLPARAGQLPDASESDFGSDVGSDFGSDFNGSDLASERKDTLGELPQTAKPQRKRRIGTKTDLSGFSMSSSANYRNKGLALLDDRFDKVEAEYAEEEESEEEGEFDMTKERSDLESIMDDFLDNYVVEGKKMWRK